MSPSRSAEPVSHAVDAAGDRGDVEVEVFNQAIWDAEPGSDVARTVRAFAGHVALANVPLANVALANVALANVALANVALANVALANVALANVALANVALANVALAKVPVENVPAETCHCRGMSPTVLIAPDSFKGSASAAAVAAAIGEGWSSVRPADRVVLAPMADGGEGTLDAFEVAVPGSVRHPVTVLGPAGREVEASWLHLPDGTAVVELAETSGLAHMPELAPLDAHTFGFGQAIAAAIDAGATGLLLALGGSSSTDGGVGALAALGARFTDATGRPIRLGNRGLGTLARADLSGLPPLPAGGVRILSDVTNPLLGPSGAAAVFGPQKGANPDQVIGLESGLTRLARVLGRRPDASGVAAGAGAAGAGAAGAGAAGAGAGGAGAAGAGAAGAGAAGAGAAGAGAAGGTGYGLLAWGAELAPGAAAVGEALGLPALVGAADAVLTGEGRFDSQSAAGKVPAYVSALAKAAGVPALLVAGSIEAPTDDFVGAVSLSELAGGSAAAIADATRWARAAGAALATVYTAS